jgi:DNA polymerase-3 subunit delta
MANNLFFFTGEESFLLQSHVKSWKSAFLEKHGEMNLDVLHADETPLSDIMASCLALPFLGDKRLLFIYGLPEKPPARQTGAASKKDEKKEEALKKFADNLSRIPESSVVVFIQQQPDKRKTFYKKLTGLAEEKVFSPLSGTALTTWIRQRFNEKGIQIGTREADYLSHLAGQNLWRLSQEVNKLASYAQGQTVTRQMIDHLVSPTLEANVFQLTDALGIKDQKKAVYHLHRSMAAGENLRPVFYMVVRQFRLLLQALGHQTANKSHNATSFAALLKVHPFVARNTFGQLKHFSFDELKQAYDKLLEIDVALKTSRIRITVDDQDELALAMERFIMEFCS